MFEVKGFGKIDINYMILKAKSLLLEPMKAQKSLEDIMAENPGLITGAIYIAIIAFISAISTLILSPIINVIVWAILTIISFIIGLYLTKKEIKIDLPLIAPLTLK